MPRGTTIFSPRKTDQLLTIKQKYDNHWNHNTDGNRVDRGDD